MSFQVSDPGGISQELARDVLTWWQEAAEKAGISLLGFDSTAPLEEQIAWALAQGLEIGTVYSRYSSKRQHSTSDQIRTCVQMAAMKGIFCPAEFVSIDEAQRGYRARRQGLSRMLAILKSRQAKVLLVFKASRLYRQAFKGYQLIQQEVVEEGLRAISVTQGIDTTDTKAWRMLFQVHGMVDDMVVEATADHVRAGLKGLFSRGYTVGALPVGYIRKELPNAPLTNRGLARTEAEIDTEIAALIRKHFELIRDGMPISVAWQQWVAEGGPVDPRSSKGYTSYSAYRRMLARIAYTGRFEFGRKRNEFSTKRDYARQIPQADREVEVFLCEELRIVEDELFFAVQKRLADLKMGPRGPRKKKLPQLCDLVVDLFWCAKCNERFYQTGAQGKGMQCKNGALCPCKSAVQREEAVKAVCAKLSELVQQDADLMQQTFVRAQVHDAQGDDNVRREISVMERKIAIYTAKIDHLYEMAGQGSEDDRKEVLAKVKSTQSERSSARLEHSRLQQQLSATSTQITAGDVQSILANFGSLLEAGAAGKLGPDAVYKAVSVFDQLVGGRIWVQVEQRPGRKQTNVRGMFHPRHLKAVSNALGRLGNEVESTPPQQIAVWLRKPPRLDAIAERVHILMDLEGLSYRDVAKQFKSEGMKVNSGNVWYSYRRWYEMQGLPVPKRPYNNGKKRKSA